MLRLTLTEPSMRILKDNSEFTKKWIKGLRSGKYKQIKEAMVKPEIENSACCLMVAEIENGRKWSDHYCLDNEDHKDIVAGLPHELCSANAWTEEIRACESDIGCVFTPEEWNDNIGLTFNQIADLLENGMVKYEE